MLQAAIRTAYQLKTIGAQGWARSVRPVLATPTAVGPDFNPQRSQNDFLGGSPGLVDCDLMQEV